jgi:hypothetical protein
VRLRERRERVMIRTQKLSIGENYGRGGNQLVMAGLASAGYGRDDLA